MIGKRIAAGHLYGPVSILLVALSVTALNAYKPLIIDDTAYSYYARQMAEHPDDPYGFEVFWFDYPRPANHVLAPPVLPYWWSLGISLFGERPILWKLWLFPFPLMLALGLYSLLKRIAPGREVPLLWLTALSPALITGLNLMLDLPALSLRILALCVFIDACDRERSRNAVLAGLLAGLAMQTKYTGALAPALMLAYALASGRWRLGLIAACTASAVFVGWEAFIAARYGESHFIHSLDWVEGWAGEKPFFAWSLALLSLLGATAPALGLLGLIALRVPGRFVAGAACIATLAFAMIPALPADRFAELGGRLPDFNAPRPELFLFLPLGFVVAGIFLAVVWRLLGERSDGSAATELGRASRAFTGLDAFLVAWLVIEILGFFVLSPAASVRRVSGICVILILVGARVLARTPTSDRERRSLHWLAAWGSVLGLLFAIADGADALARKQLVTSTAQELERLGADPRRETIWFLGHWGFQFYAERAGMKPVIPGVSRLEAGDWLLVSIGFVQSGVRIREESTQPVKLVSSRSYWPWTTVPSAYAGPIPIRSQPERHAGAMIYRVVEATTVMRGEPSSQ